jgi:hypothetical protein
MNGLGLWPVMLQFAHRDVEQGPLWNHHSVKDSLFLGDSHYLGSWWH